MNLEQLEYILEVSKRGTISKAAEVLHVSHSAISQSITNLELELEVPIFKRSRSGSVTTESGKKVIQIAQEIMNSVNQLKGLGEKTSQMKGNISISSSPIFFSTVLPEALYSFKNDYPDIQIEVNEDSTEDIIQTVKNDQLNVGFIFGSEETYQAASKQLLTNSIYKPKLMVSMSKYSSLANHKYITPQQLLKYPLIIRNEKFAKRVWEKIFAHYGKGDILFYSNNDDVIKNVIANNLAIGFSTDLMKHDPLIKNGTIINIPFKDDKTKPTLHLMSIQAKSKKVGLIETEFIKRVTHYINSII